MLYMSKKKAQIEIKAEYITIGEQFVRFNLQQKRISSTAVIMMEDDSLTIYKAYIQIYLQFPVTLAENVYKFCFHD